MVRWEIVKIGAYAAGELSGEEAREAERLIREAPEALELAESYTRLLDCLSAVGRDSPVPPPAIHRRLRRVVGDPLVCEPHEPSAGEGCSKSRTRRYKKGRPKK
jgi:hypothetical protein